MGVITQNNSGDWVKSHSRWHGLYHDTHSNTFALLCLSSSNFRHAGSVHFAHSLSHTLRTFFSLDVYFFVSCDFYNLIHVILPFLILLSKKAHAHTDSKLIQKAIERGDIIQRAVADEEEKTKRFSMERR